MEQNLEILDAFVDGERVDPQALKRALSDPDGRDYLIDILALREGIRDGISDDVALQAIGPVRSTSEFRSRFRWLSAAAVIAVSLLGGYVLGQQTGRPATTTSASAITSVERPNVAVAPVATVPAPAPTHVIRLEPGVDWNEHIGGE